ncbi:MAG: hypothetical protein SFX18_19515 [Pirellulales bacterium]|nr:hypothetical protein [Pirellulales bacterium]
MATDNLLEIAGFDPTDCDFRPYCAHNETADTLLIRIREDADYYVRLNQHVTKLLSIDTNELVGVLIKNICAITSDLPNFVKIKHGKEWLTVVLLKSWEQEQDQSAKRQMDSFAQEFLDNVSDESLCSH